MLNSTYLIRYLEKKLGYKFTDLEISHEDILENIRMDTLPTFSLYFPFEQTLQIDAERDRVENEQNNIYYLNSDLDIINVAKVVGDDPLFGYEITSGNINAYLDPFQSQMTTDALSMIKNPITYKFIPPNKIQIFPDAISKQTLLIVLNCVHLENFSSIPINLRNVFLKLALLDTKDALYQIRHRFSNLQTPFGSMELFIDDLQEASNQKEEFIENLRSKQLFRANRKKIYIC